MPDSKLIYIDMAVSDKIGKYVTESVYSLYGKEIPSEKVLIQPTRKEFTGDFTVIVFAFSGISKKKPEETGEDIGKYLVEKYTEISSYNVIKGFLNLTLNTSFWLSCLNEAYNNANYGFIKENKNPELVMVEYSSPNTNKPLHLGHVRNNLLGYSLCKILEANGKKVIKTNIVNDRGIHICKSMLAWLKWGNGETPESSGKKGDHLIGDYYVAFDKHYKQEVNEYISSKNIDLNSLPEEEKEKIKKEAEESSPLMKEAREMLVKWENGDKEVRDLWTKMNNWVYAGFDETYKMLGVSFDKIYYESETYLIGKKVVLDGLEKGLFLKEKDGSVWADLTKNGLDRKILLRKDGTSVYMTQDIGTASLRFKEYPIDKMIYVVGNEQNYHFQVLSILLDRVGFKWGKDLTHFSYGMVELPEGKMKSREGTVVDADELMEEMIATAKETSGELGKLDELSKEEADNIAKTIGLGALKYFILKVDPKKNMMFNPKESIDFNGNTGPFIQYSYARIKSVLRKAVEAGIKPEKEIKGNLPLSEKELSLIKSITAFPETVKEAGDSYSPAIIANYVYGLSKEYNQFYHDYSILKEKNEDLKIFRTELSEITGKIIKSGMGLLGINVPERM